MLRKIKVFLYLIITIATIFLFAKLVHIYDDNSLPNNPTIVEVYGSAPIKNWNKKNIKKWNKKYNKKTFFAKLQKFSHAKNISLVKLRTNNFNDHQSKIVYSFGNSSNDYSLYKSGTVKKLSNKELQLEDINGIYCTNAKNEALGELTSLLHLWGLKIRTGDNSLSFKYILTMVMSELSNTNLAILLGSMGILFIVMVLEKLYRFKAYAVMKINGLRNRQIFTYDLKREVPLLVSALGLIILILAVWGFCSFTVEGWATFLPYLFPVILLLVLVFLFLNTLSYLVFVLLEPYAAIKGEERSGSFLLIGYILKIVLLLMIMLNTISLYKDYQIYTRDTGIIKKLYGKENGYSLGLSWHTSDKPEDIKVARQVHKLVVQSHKAIVSYNSQEFRPEKRDVQPENGNVITANKNFLMNSGLISKNIKVDENKVLLLIPQNRLDQLENAKKQLMNFIKFQNKLPNYYRKKKKKLPTIQVVPIENDRKIFNYTVGDEILSSISINPLIIVVNNRLLSDDFYLSTTSQGMIRFANLKSLQSMIKNLGLVPYTVGITSQQALLSDYVTKANSELLMLTITAIISLLELIFIITFVSSTFLQSQRHKMAVYYVFGKSNVKMIISFLIINVGLDLLVITLILVKQGYLNLMPFALCYLLIEALTILITYDHARHNLLITLNRGN